MPTLAPHSQVWTDLDPRATNFIPAVQLACLVAELDAPLGARGEPAGRAALQAIMLSVDVPVHAGGKVREPSLYHGWLSPRVGGLQGQLSVGVHAQ